MGRKNAGKPAMPVGMSDRRTPAKHALFDKMLGEEVSAARYCAPKLGTELRRLILVDATAGDGSSAGFGNKPWHKDCTAGLFASHAAFDRAGEGIVVEVILNELKPENYSALLDNLAINLPALGYIRMREDRWMLVDSTRCVELNATLGDAREMLDRGWGRGDFGIISNDPNTVLKWAMPLEPLVGLANARGAYMRSFNTMGCNPGGLKAWNDRDIRSRSFDNVASELDQIVGSQDVLLYVIDRDASQWAYLVTTPRKWVDRSILQAQKVFASEGLSITTVSYRRDPLGFDRMLDVLFLTKEERGA